MIALLVGTIEERSADSVVLLTNSGIGFSVSVPSSYAAKAGADGKPVKMLTLTTVNGRDGSMQLFGFEHAGQRDMFTRLTAVGGVGPKAAMSILSTLTVQELLAAIATNDTKSISRAPGVGKKVAERIVLELRGKMDLMIEGTQNAAFVPAAAEDAPSEAVQALMALGYTGQEAMQAIAKLNDPTAKTEDLIMRALRALDQQ